MNVKVNYPEYWAKRKNRISKDLFDKLYETAKREAVVSDEYGLYKPGTFLHRNTIVTVELENNLWVAHIWSEQPIGMPLIKEVRNTFIPGNIEVAMVMGTRKQEDHLKGVILMEIPTNNDSEQ